MPTSLTRYKARRRAAGAAYFTTQEGCAIDRGLMCVIDPSFDAKVSGKRRSPSYLRTREL